jgi:L-aminopeptidase/D-esterase-like protein
MICHLFKGGIGTSSRVVDIQGKTYTVGVLVQANHGDRKNLHISGIPVGEEIPDLLPEIDQTEPEPVMSSIIMVIATDAPLLPNQLNRLAKRAPLGIGLVGGVGANYSGDIAIAFSTANHPVPGKDGINKVDFLSNSQVTPLMQATIQATEESIVNAMVAAKTMTGINGNKVYALPHDRVQSILRKYNRLLE